MRIAFTMFASLLFLTGTARAQYYADAETGSVWAVELLTGLTWEF